MEVEIIGARFEWKSDVVLECLFACLKRMVRGIKSRTQL